MVDTIVNSDTQASVKKLQNSRTARASVSGSLVIVLAIVFQHIPLSGAWSWINSPTMLEAVAGLAVAVFGYVITLKHSDYKTANADLVEGLKTVEKEVIDELINKVTIVDDTATK